MKYILIHIINIIIAIFKIGLSSLLSLSVLDLNILTEVILADTTILILRNLTIK